MDAPGSGLGCTKASRQPAGKGRPCSVHGAATCRRCDAAQATFHGLFPKAPKAMRAPTLLAAKLFLAICLFLAPQCLVRAVRADHDRLLGVARSGDAQGSTDTVAVLDAFAHAGVDQE